MNVFTLFFRISLSFPDEMSSSQPPYPFIGKLFNAIPSPPLLFFFPPLSPPHHLKKAECAAFLAHFFFSLSPSGRWEKNEVKVVLFIALDGLEYEFPSFLFFPHSFSPSASDKHLPSILGDSRGSTLNQSVCKLLGCFFFN